MREVSRRPLPENRVSHGGPRHNSSSIVPAQGRNVRTLGVGGGKTRNGEVLYGMAVTYTSGSSRPASVRDPVCLDALDIVRFRERRLRGAKRLNAESHLVDCGACRQSLAMAARIHSGADELRGSMVKMSRAGIRDQALKVLAMIERDERARRRSA